MPDYNFLATECPALTHGTDLIDPTASAKYPPITTKLVVTDSPITLIPVAQELAVRVDLASRHGGCRGRAVAQGLGITDGGGLLATIGVGQALVDGVVTLNAADDAVLTDDAGGVTRNQVWITQAGALTVRTDLTAPASPAAHLGSVVTAAGAITSIDYSGRLEMRGGVLYRRTADIGPPGDTPPASIQFLAQTQTGYYWWTGAAYVRLWEALADGQDVLAAGEVAHVPSNCQKLIADSLQVDAGASCIVEGRLVIWRE